ncbi:MAG TPA: hypothetical protein VG675_12060 [Bryobacteraceae bacterium]|nr:hypothetical protein [Bryobacteraceae bacterium]
MTDIECQAAANDCRDAVCAAGGGVERVLAIPMEKAGSNLEKWTRRSGTPLDDVADGQEMPFEVVSSRVCEEVV